MLFRGSDPRKGNLGDVATIQKCLVQVLVLVLGEAMLVIVRRKTLRLRAPAPARTSVIALQLAGLTARVLAR